MRKLLTTLLFLIFCVGCATTNPFYQFYQDQTGGADITTVPTVVLPSGEPKIYSGSNVDADVQKMLEEGFWLLGYSSFNAGNVNERQLIAKAKDVKAEVVVFYSQYTNTISGSVPLTLPDNKTITTNTSGSAYGSGNVYGYGGSAYYSGSGSYYGNSNTTVYGTKTTYIPYSQNRYDYLATYWIKMKKPILGVYANDLPSEIREKIGSNKGVIISAVVRKSPAFMADILRGDIIRKVNDLEITDAITFHESLPQFADQMVSIEILRDGKSIIKEVKLNNAEIGSQQNPIYETQMTSEDLKTQNDIIAQACSDGRISLDDPACK
jgi:hypothetical protein